MRAGVQEVGGAQRERLAYIDFRLYFLGAVSRSDISARFGVASAAATRDLARYRALAPDNILFDARTKTYLIGAGFKPVFEHPIERVLSALSMGFGDGLGGTPGGLVPCEFPTSISRPSIETLAVVSRAIRAKSALRISYVSSASGLSERVIVPFALVDNGLRWHTRAFDRKSSSFRDFALNRIVAAGLAEGSALPAEEPGRDIQWSRLVDLELVPHPHGERLELAALDYPMVDGKLRIVARAALAGYVLRRWSVDCSPDHSLRGPEYRLWLHDPLALYDVESAAIAPGYVPPPEVLERG